MFGRAFPVVCISGALCVSAAFGLSARAPQTAPRSIAGVSFEIIRFAGAHYDKPWVRWMSTPGLELQRLTTREPSRDMLEVAIAALRAVL